MLCKLISLRLKSLLSKTQGKGGKWVQIVVLSALALSTAGLGALFYFVFSELAQVLCGTPLAWFYFAIAGLLSFGISFFFTAFAAKSELFEAKDNELLLSLPIKPRTILLSRLSILLLSEYLLSLLIFIPAGIAWAMQDGLSFLPSYLLGALSLPLLTAALAAIVGWLLAILTAKARRKNLLTIIFSLIFMALYFYVYSNIGDYVNLLLTHYRTISESIVGWGFLFHWYGLGIADGDFVRLLAVVGIAVCAFAASIWAISHGFLRISSASTSRGKKAPKFSQASAKKTLFLREFHHLFASPVYLLNCGIGVLMIVGIAIFLLIKRDFLVNLLAMVPMSETSSALLCSLLMGLLSTMCCFTAASISLEGRQLWIIRSAPLEAQTVLDAKLHFHLSLTAPSLLILSLSAGIALTPSALGWVIFLIVPQLVNVLCAQFGLMVNLLFPKFDWKNENEPVKQSLSVFLAMIVPMLLTAALVGCLLFVELNGRLYTIATTILLTLLNFLCYIWLGTKGARRYDHLS